MDNIASKLGITQVDHKSNIIEYEPRDIVIGSPEEQLDNDRKYARENFYQTIENGSRALEQMLEIAQQSMQPRAFEVVATLMKTLIDANKDLVDMSSKQVESIPPKEQERQINNTLVFSGSTSELLELIQKKKDE